MADTLSRGDLDDFKWLITDIREMMESGFFGDLTIRFQDGKIISTHKMTTDKPPRKRRRQSV